MQRRYFIKTLSILTLIAISPSLLLAKGKKAKKDRHTNRSLDRLRGNRNRNRNKDVTAPTPETLKLLIPLYSYPVLESGESAWQPLIDLKQNYPEVEIVAIVNPSNGHFREQDSNFYQGIQKLTAANIHVVGYVYTQYGLRLNHDVLDDVKAWQEFYQEAGVRGIFFDEVSNTSDDLSHYQSLSEQTKAQGFTSIILNPGITTDQSYVDANIADIIVTYEETNREQIINPPISYNTPTETTHLATLIYEMEDNTIDDLISFAQEHQFSYVYFTDDGFDGNPWDDFSSYLNEQATKV